VSKEDLRPDKVVIQMSKEDGRVSKEGLRTDKEDSRMSKEDGRVSKEDLPEYFHAAVATEKANLQDTKTIKINGVHPF